MNLVGSPESDIGLSVGSLDMLTTLSRLGGIRSLTRSNLRASSKLPIFSFHSSRAVEKAGEIIKLLDKQLVEIKCKYHHSTKLYRKLSQVCAVCIGMSVQHE